MTSDECARLLLEVGAVELRRDPADWFTWTSGERAPIYCDNRVLVSYPAARAAVADGLVASIRQRFAGVEVVAGTATAGIPHAAWVAERLDLPMVYVRGSAKGHGKKKRVEGRPLDGERVVLIEDLVSLGGSAAAALEGLAEEGGKVIGMQAIFSYGFPAADARIAELAVPWHALTGYDALVDLLDPDPPTRQLLLDWRNGHS